MSLDDRNAELNKKLEENPIDDIVGALVKADNRRRAQVRWLAVSLTLDVLLTFGFGWVTIQTHHLAAKAESNQTALIRNCETANDSRRNNRVLWGYILALPTSQELTVEQQQTRAEFKAFVDKTFAPRDCQSEIGT